MKIRACKHAQNDQRLIVFVCVFTVLSGTFVFCVTESLSVNSNSKLDKLFKKILRHGPAEIWKRQVKNMFVETVVNSVVMVSKFEKAIQGFIAIYCTSQDPKGDLIEYLKSNNCMKPHEKSVAKHQGRMEELMRYSTHLEGSRADVSETE